MLALLFPTFALEAAAFRACIISFILCINSLLRCSGGRFWGIVFCINCNTRKCSGLKLGAEPADEGSGCWGVRCGWFEGGLGGARGSSGTPVSGKTAATALPSPAEKRQSMGLTAPVL